MPSSGNTLSPNHFSDGAKSLFLRWGGDPPLPLYLPGDSSLPLPSQSFFSNGVVWIAGQDGLASSTYDRARIAKLMGLQTMVLIPLPNGVVELGSFYLISQSPDLINQVRVLFNATNQIEAPPPPNSQSNEVVWIAGQDGFASSTYARARQAQLWALQTMVLIPLPNATNQIEAPPPPNSQRMEKENQSISGNIVIPHLTEESNVPYDFQGQEGDYESEPEFHPEEGDTGIGVTNEKKEATRKLTSNVWKRMTRFDKTLDDGTIYIYARCETCSREFAADPKKNGTTKLRKHLERCHGSPLYEDISTSQTLLTQDTFGVLVSMKFDQKRLERKCVEWIIHAELSFRTLENLKFKEFVNELQPNFKIPNRKSIAKGILELYMEEKEKLKNQLKGVRVSLTIDTWTSVQNFNYMVVTAHFVDEGWVLHKRIINFKKIVSHTGVELGKVLDSCLLEWGIQKVFNITLDIASANDGLIAYAKNRLRRRGILLSEGIFMHMRCACHILNMIVRDGMEELGSCVEAIRNCVKFLHSSPASLDVFRSICAEEGLDAMSIIGMDVVTRWNSTYHMLHTAEKFKKVFNRMKDDFLPFKLYFIEDRKRAGPPTDENWEQAKRLADFLEMFYDATETLSATKTPTITLVLITILSLQADIDNTINGSDHILQSVSESMKKKFDKYWLGVDKSFPIMFIALALDPRAKMDMFEVLLEGIHSNTERITEVKNLVRQHLNNLLEEYEKITTESDTSEVEDYSRVTGETRSGSHIPTTISCSTTSGTTFSGSSKRDKLNVASWEKLEAKRQASHIVVITNEIDKYLTDPCESTKNAPFVLLDWWKLNAEKYPVLALIARDVFAIPSSSVASEGAFSLGGRVVDSFRASLTPKIVEALVCTSNWLRGEDFQFYRDLDKDMTEMFIECEQIEKVTRNPVSRRIEGMEGEELEVASMQLPTPTVTPTPIPNPDPLPSRPQSPREFPRNRGVGRAQVGKRGVPSSNGKPPLHKRTKH